MKKIPHNVCAWATVKMCRKLLQDKPMKNWPELLKRFENNIERKWSRHIRGSNENS